MSLASSIGVGALLGGVAAVAVYAATVPAEEGRVALTVVPTLAPVPAPTVTRTALGCEPPAVLAGGECVVTRPGPTVTPAAPPVGAPVGSAQSPGADDSGGDRARDDSDDDDDRFDDHGSDDD